MRRNDFLHAASEWRLREPMEGTDPDLFVLCVVMSSF